MLCSMPCHAVPHKLAAMTRRETAEKQGIEGWEGEDEQSVCDYSKSRRVLNLRCFYHWKDAACSDRLTLMGLIRLFKQQPTVMLKITDINGVGG